MAAQLISSAIYTFNPYAVPLLVAATAVVLLGLFSLARDRITLISVSFFMVTLAVAIWLFASSWAFLSANAEAGLWWSRAAYLGIPFIASATYQFTVAVLKIHRRYMPVVVLGWVVALAFSLAAIFSDTLVQGVYSYWWGYYTSFGWLGLPFIMYFGTMLGASMTHYVIEHRKAQPGTHKLRIRALMLAFAVGYVGSVDFVATYGIGLYPFGYLAILGFVILSARAIWAYHLQDITPAFAARQIINTMTDALLVLDRNAVLRVVNQAAVDLFGYSREELVDRPIAETINGALFSEHLQRLIDEGSIRDYEMPYNAHAGEPRILNLSASVMRDKQGNPLAVVCIARDITETRRAEDEIRRLNETLERRVEERTAQLQTANEELGKEVVERMRAEEERARLLGVEQLRAIQLRRLAEASLVVNSVLSLDEMLEVITEQARVTIGAHQAVTCMTAREGEEASVRAIAFSEKYSRWSSPDELQDPHASELYTLVTSTNKPLRMTQAELEAHPALKGGGAYPQDGSGGRPMRGWLAAPLIDRDGLNLGLIELSDKEKGEFTDQDEAMLVQFAQMASVAIENARLYSEAQEAVRAREVLMSIVSHDLRNLLSAIKGSANLLKRVVPPPAEGEPPLTKNGLERIDRAVARMNGIIGELLDFARVRAGQQLDLLLRRTDLVAVSRQVAAEYRQSTDRHRIEVTAALPELWGIWDASRIERVLDNLVSNAIKYSPRGGEITLEIVCEQAGGEEYAVFTVRDEGIGIPEADLPDVFGWFQRAGNVSGRISGTGIGLASVKQVVEQHGGTVSVCSKEGEGSTFTVRLPLAAPPYATMPEPSSAPTLPLDGSKIG